MYQDFNQYLQWLQMCIQAQEQRIVSLEATLQKMREEIKQLSEMKSIHVDRIEYKFDQLKVETLEGTLNIGLNPNDLSGIDDFAVQNQTKDDTLYQSLSTPSSSNSRLQRSIRIEEAIYQYLETDLPVIIEETQKKQQLEPNGAYLTFIKDDIIKQLPSRIDNHLRAYTAQGRASESGTDIESLIIEAIKQEIQNGVAVFLNNVPEHVKGMKAE
jgi:spore germination protein PC